MSPRQLVNDNRKTRYSLDNKYVEVEFGFEQDVNRKSIAFSGWKAVFTTVFKTKPTRWFAICIVLG